MLRSRRSFTHSFLAEARSFFRSRITESISSWVDCIVSNRAITGPAWSVEGSAIAESAVTKQRGTADGEGVKAPFESSVCYC